MSRKWGPNSPGPEAKHQKSPSARDGKRVQDVFGESFVWLLGFSVAITIAKGIYDHTSPSDEQRQERAATEQLIIDCATPAIADLPEPIDFYDALDKTKECSRIGGSVALDNTVHVRITQEILVSRNNAD